MNLKVVVVGSSNTDLIVQVSRLPASGETGLGRKFITTGGGKGANQAIASALSQGKEFTDAIRYANVARVICVTRWGAQPALPTADEIRVFLDTRKCFDTYSHTQYCYNKQKEG